MVAGLRVCLDIAAQPALARYLGERFLPAPGDDSDEALLRMPAGQERDDLPPDLTAAMGPADDRRLRPAAAGAWRATGCGSSTRR